MYKKYTITHAHRPKGRAVDVKCGRASKRSLMLSYERKDVGVETVDIIDMEPVIDEWTNELA